MNKKYEIINIFTANLPREVAVPMYKEFENRFKDVTWQIENREKYNFLKNHLTLVKHLLALSIFHRRVIANLDGALTFFGTVTKLSQAQGISIGSYEFNVEERNKLLGLTISYEKLLEQYRIRPGLLEYLDTRDFMKNLLILKRIWEDAEA